jgi:hypothetical protein
MAPFHERSRNMRADESGNAGKKNVHAFACLSY